MAVTNGGGVATVFRTTVCMIYMYRLPLYSDNIKRER